MDKFTRSLLQGMARSSTESDSCKGTVSPIPLGMIKSWRLLGRDTDRALEDNKCMGISERKRLFGLNGRRQKMLELVFMK
jgi:hypothetical protein